MCIQIYSDHFPSMFRSLTVLEYFSDHIVYVFVNSYPPYAVSNSCLAFVNNLMSSVHLRLFIKPRKLRMPLMLVGLGNSLKPYICSPDLMPYFLIL